MRVLAAPDKLAGTLDAVEAAHAIARGARPYCSDVVELPLSDGGEGFAALFGGIRHDVTVAGPLGDPVSAPFWLLDKQTAVIEMASAAGRTLLPDPQDSDVMDATTAGVGQLILAAQAAGARTIIVGCGGSATTDGGKGAVDAIESGGGLTNSVLLVATDVTTAFEDAAPLFGPQKGATPDQVRALSRRLHALRAEYQLHFGIDVGSLGRSGAAGGLAGGLAALGGQLISGFDAFAQRFHLEEILPTFDLVVTAEGQVDESTLQGKVVASLATMLNDSTPLLVVAGRVEPGAGRRLQALRSGPTAVLDMSASAGRDRSMNNPAEVLAELVASHLEALASR